MSATESLRNAMQSAGLEYSGPIIADGELHRFKAEKDKRRCSWYVLHLGSPAAGAFGCWKRNFKESWCDGEIKTLDDAKQREVRESWRKANEVRQALEQNRASKATKTAQWIYNHSTEDANGHPYLTRKGIQPTGIIRHRKGLLVIPLQDATGKLTSLQFIDGEGNKRFLREGKIAGSYCILSDHPNGPLVICEGIATGLSIYEATGYAVVCAMNCGNLLAVAQTMRQLHPNRDIIIAADDDSRTTGNPGLTHAHAAVLAIDARMAVPIFLKPNQTATDFNDLHQSEGLEKVKDQISNATRPKETIEELITRLAKLSSIEYDLCRETEAKAAGVRVATLDKAVNEKRGSKAKDGLQGKALAFEEVEPWPDPVNGAEVLSRVSEVISSYVALPKELADMTALWCAHTHVYDVFLCTPRLNISAPAKGCGKTTLRDVIGLLVPRPIPAENLTSAVLFRVIEKFRPTILADEYDTWIAFNEELRGIVNSGHRRGGGVLRCVGDDQEVHLFQVYAPMALAGIGTLPGTILDRSIVIRLVRAKPGEVCRRFDSRNIEEETNLCRKMARWCADNRVRLEGADPAMPPEAVNRVADNWRPLFAIAQLAGGDWPSRAEAAFKQITQCRDAEEDGTGTILLQDIRSVFEDLHCTRIKSSELCDELAGMEGHPWMECGKSRKPITPSVLASLLKPYKIYPRNMKLPGNSVPKGYYLDDFAEVFDRFLLIQEDPSRYPATEAENIDDSAHLHPLPGLSGSASENTVNSNRIKGGSGVAVPEEDVEYIDDDNQEAANYEHN